MTSTVLSPAFLNRLEALQLSVKWVRAGSLLGGRFPVNRRGSSVEFADYTVYTPGDDIRSIDWNLYARLDRLFVKTYKEEIALSVEVMVDATASMGLPDPEKFERAKRLALSLAYIGVAESHYVRFSWIKPGPVTRSPWFHQRRDRTQMSRLVNEAAIGARISLDDWMRRAVHELRIQGGQAIIITDGMVSPAALFRCLHALMVRNLELKVIQVLSPQELHPARLFRGGTVVDIETGNTHELAYSPDELERAVAGHNEQLARFCAQHRIAFARHRLDEAFDAFLFKTLPARGFLR